MTSRQRWLAALELEPLDHLPFWPKLNPSYPPAQAEPFTSMSIREIHDWIGSDRHEGCGDCTRSIRSCTSTSLLSPAQYREYGLRQVGEIAEMAREK